MENSRTCDVASLLTARARNLIGTFALWSNQSLAKDPTRDWTDNPWPCHKFHFDLTPENLSIRPKSKHVYSVNHAAVGDLLPVNTLLRTRFDRLKISSCGPWAVNNPELFSHTKRHNWCSLLIKSGMYFPSMTKGVMKFKWKWGISLTRSLNVRILPPRSVPKRKADVMRFLFHLSCRRHWLTGFHRETARETRSDDSAGVSVAAHDFQVFSIRELTTVDREGWMKEKTKKGAWSWRSLSWFPCRF